jgi:hypothetical protein
MKIRRLPRLAGKVALPCCIAILIGCSTSGGNPPVEFPRTTWPQVATSLYPDYPGPVPGQETIVSAPYQAYVTVSVRAASGDPAKFWTRAEVDYGDGAGWIDITPQAKYFWKHGGKTPEAYILKQFPPGDYHIRSRAFYYDGEVLESEDVFDIVVTP